ncbi:MAG TPA: HNH endonuclease signature motif containing protein [Pyrinomonadaceae bacterium]
MPNDRKRTNRRTGVDPVKARVRQMHATLRRRGGTMSLNDFRDLYRERVDDYTRCPYCLEFLTADTVSLDHKVPVKRGGSHGPENLEFVCKGCNAQKGQHTAAEFASLIRHLREWERDNRNFKLAAGVLTALRVASSFRIGANRRAKK